MQDNLSYQAPVSELSVEDRSQFIWKCYAHVVGAVLAFAAISAYLYTSGISANIAGAMPLIPTLHGAGRGKRSGGRGCQDVRW